MLQIRKVKVAPRRYTRKVRSISVLTLSPGAGWGLCGHVTPRPLYWRERAPVEIVEEVGWVLAPVWAGK